MPVLGQDALLEFFGIRAGHEHVHIVVRFHDQVVGLPCVAHRIVGHFAQIGHHGKAFARQDEVVAHGLGGVVRDDEGRDAKPAVEHLLAPLFQVAYAALQFAGRADIVAQGLFERAGQVHGLVVALRKAAQAADMVEMVMGHEYAADGRKVDVVFGQTLLDGAGSDADVDEERLLAVAEIIAVAVASAREAQEPDHVYLVLRRFLMSRGLRMPFSVTMPAIREAGVTSNAGL